MDVKDMFNPIARVLKEEYDKETDMQAVRTNRLLHYIDHANTLICNMKQDPNQITVENLRSVKVCESNITFIIADDFMREDKNHDSYLCSKRRCHVCLKNKCCLFREEIYEKSFKKIHRAVRMYNSISSCLSCKRCDIDDKECPICMDPMSWELNNETFFVWKCPQCSNSCHSSCISKWIFEKNSTCPFCRYELFARRVRV